LGQLSADNSIKKNFWSNCLPTIPSNSFFHPFVGRSNCQLCCLKVGLLKTCCKTYLKLTSNNVYSQNEKQTNKK
jgi:hypothetical protein